MESSACVLPCKPARPRTLPFSASRRSQSTPCPACTATSSCITKLSLFSSRSNWLPIGPSLTTLLLCQHLARIATAFFLVALAQHPLELSNLPHRPAESHAQGGLELGFTLLNLQPIAPARWTQKGFTFYPACDIATTFTSLNGKPTG